MVKERLKLKKEDHINILSIIKRFPGISLIILLSLIQIFPIISSINRVNAASSWLQNDWSGGSGQFNYVTANKFYNSYGLTSSTQLSIARSLNWYDNNWSYRKTVTIDHTKITNTLNNFPLLVSLATDANLSSNALSTGNDILFTASDGTTKLDHEIEKYDNTTGNLQAWVRVPTVLSTTDTVIYMYYGNAAAVSQQNKVGVWDSNFSQVLHLAETTGHHIDSTSNLNNSTSETALVAKGTATGKVGGADQFNASTITVPNNANNSLVPSSALTLEAWVNLSQLPSVNAAVETIFRKQYSATPFNSYTLTANTPTNNVQISWYNTLGTAYSRGSNTILTTSNWYYVVGVITGTTVKMYINGVDDSAGAAPTTTSTLESSTNPLFIGSGGSGVSSPLLGVLDELRISNTSRSSDYINATYKNVNSPQTFITLGTQNLPWDISNWYNSSWQYRKRIVIDHTKVSNSQTDFPFLLNQLTDSDLSSKALSTGNDILFTASDGSTKLDHEIEKYDNTTGRIIAWIRIPALSSSVDTEIYMYYGNASASNQQNKVGVWDANFGAVWHFSESGATHHQDSTSNSNASTSETAITQKGADIGKVDGADQLLASTITVPNNANSSLLPGAIMTVEAWVKLDQIPSQLSAIETVLRKQVSGTPFNSYTVTVNTPSNNVQFSWYNSSGTSYSRGSKTALATNAWYYIAGTIDGTGMKLYINGIDDSNLTSPTPTGTLVGSNNPIFIGSGGTGTTNPLVGTIDEIRISKVVRSSDYFLINYRNINSTQTFYSLGAETAFALGRGVLNSSIYNTSQQSDFGTLTYAVTTPTGTSSQVKVRTGNTISMNDATNFDNCPNISSGTALSSTSCVKPSQRYVQYQVTLQTTNNNNPSFQSITINYSTASPLNFIQKVDTNLYLNGQKFKFGGANIYWLGLDESTVNLPTKFKIDDAINTADELGSKVIRTFGALSVGCANCIETSLGTFNASNLDSLDYAIYKAGLKNIKMTLPLVDNFHYYNGGKHTFTDWRGLSNEDNFFTDPTVISDFKSYISFVLNHVNTYNGIAYKNDPTIMAWETGNELSATNSWIYYDWTESIAKYIKTLTTNQLTQDGHTCNATTSFDVYSLSVNSLDIFTCHYYPPNNSDLQTKLSTVINSGKVMNIGEYDWTGNNGGDTLSSFFTANESSTTLAGDLFWNLQPHQDTQGYLIHNEQYSLYYPGTTGAMTTAFQNIRTHNYNMQGVSVPSHITPSTPYLHDVTTTSTGYSIDWRGGAGANTYNVERSTDNSLWSTVGTSLTDSNTPWTDTSSNIGTRYYYRVKAINLDSVSSAYSNTSVSLGLENRNASFDYLSTTNPLAFWNLSLKNGAAATISSDATTFYDGISSAKVNITGSNVDPTSVQLTQANVSLVSGRVHTMTINMKASTARTVSITLQQNYSPYTTYFTQSFNVITGWQTFTTTYTPNVNDNNVIFRVSMGDNTGQVWIDRSMIYSTSILVQVLDSSNNVIAFPTVSSDPTVYSYQCYTILSNLLNPGYKIRVTNQTPNQQWKLSMLAKNGNSTFITSPTQNIAYNDPTACVNGTNVNGFGAQMSIDTSSVVITPANPCTSTGLSVSSNQTFVKNVSDNLGLVTGDLTSSNQCSWDIQGIRLSQKIPAGQIAGNYSIDLLFTALAN